MGPAARAPSVWNGLGGWGWHIGEPDGPRGRELIAAWESSPGSSIWVVLTAFALAAAPLSLIGLYGVGSGIVTERLHEMGVRAALGASEERLVGLVVGQGMGVAAAGLILCTAVACFVPAIRAVRADPLSALKADEV